MSIRRSLFVSAFLFVTSCVAQSSTTLQCTTFLCDDDPVIRIVMVIKYVVGLLILIAVVVWQWKRRDLYTWNDGLGNKDSYSNEQNCQLS